MRRISFRLLPASWGLVGDAYDEAEAHYNLKGEELERRLVDIRHKKNPTDRAIHFNDIDFKYRHIDSYVYETKKNELEHDDVRNRLICQIEIDKKHHKISPYDAAVKRIELVHGAPKTDEELLARNLAELDVEHEFNRIEKNAYEKRRATLKNEPWVGFIDTGFDPNNGLDGFRLELDFNSQWIEYLRLHGFVGHTDEQVLEDWFVEVCRSNAQAADPTVTVLGTSMPWNTLGKNYPMGFDDED